MAVDRFVSLAAIALSAACASPRPCPAGHVAEANPEVEVRPIALRGIEAPRGVRRHTRYAELSALAWHRDTLWLVPQYPARYAVEGASGALLAIPRARIEEALDARDPAPITPTRVPLELGAARTLDGFEGVEALVVEGDRAWAAIELRGADGAASSLLIAGTIDANGLRFGDARVALPPVTPLPNTGYEALLATPRGIVAIFEANGAVAGARSYALRVDRELREAPVPQGFPRIEYRVTDASALDRRGRFWVINYFYPGDAFLAAGGAAFTHTVERLIELEWTEGDLRPTGRAPVSLRLGRRPRNWEGIARLSGRGLLLVTDEWPDTVLGFVPVPDV